MLAMTKQKLQLPTIFFWNVVMLIESIMYLLIWRLHQLPQVVISCCPLKWLKYTYMKQCTEYVVSMIRKYILYSIILANDVEVFLNMQYAWNTNTSFSIYFPLSTKIKWHALYSQKCEKNSQLIQGMKENVLNLPANLKQFLWTLFNHSNG